MVYVSLLILVGTRNQKLMLLRREKTISAAPSIKGTRQLPDPPIKIDIP